MFQPVNVYTNPGNPASWLGFIFLSNYASSNSFSVFFLLHTSLCMDLQKQANNENGTLSQRK